VINFVMQPEVGGQDYQSAGNFHRVKAQKPWSGRELKASFERQLCQQSLDNIKW